MLIHSSIPNLDNLCEIAFNGDETLLMPIASFSLIAAAILAFVFSSILAPIIQKFKLKRYASYSFVYILLGLTFFIWGIAAALGNQDVLNGSIIFGNILFLSCALICVNMLIEDKNKIFILCLVATALVAYFLIRLLYFPIAPSVQNGILIFNTNPIIGMLLLLIVFGTFIPTSLQVAHHLAEKTPFPQMKEILSALYLMGSIAVVIFISTRNSLTLVISFILFLVSFSLLIYAHIMVSKLHKNGTN